MYIEDMMTEKEAKKLAEELGLSTKEFYRIKKILGRIPNYTEIGIFSVMWSEHCSYKSSLVYLQKFPRKNKNLVAEAGKENAGAIRLNDKWAIVFKVESHNHPSAIEPFQGAATGVGGILRDIFCMGAYPVACLDSLRFGELSNPIAQHHFDGVVRGIAAYGNCFGVPTVAGDVYFDDAYLGNPIVNAMAVGIVRIDRLISARAEGIGNPVVYIGSSTGRDGIHGASFASSELTVDSMEDRPSVQIGDPFTEKLLLEATQGIAEEKLAVGMQDMGAAGLTSSSAEMAAKCGVGIELNLDKVPLREKGMTPYEIMLSESQERMLLVATSENLPRIENILNKWGLHYSVIGKVIEEPVLRVLWRGEVAAEIPTKALLAGEGAPVYKLPKQKPEYIDEIARRNPANEIISLQKKNPEVLSVQNLLYQTLSSPTIASKQWIFQQYDHQVGTRTVVLPGADAAVMRIMETGEFLALSIDCNSRYCFLDPYEGSMCAVFECARNIAAVGGKPLGITDCLNFGNPQKPEVMWAFAESVRGISDACKTLRIPVTGGNVSFYNESPQGAIFPTPTIGMVGVIENEEHIIRPGFKKAGEVILLVGETLSEFGGSELQKILFGEYFGHPPKVDPIRERNAVKLVLLLAKKHLITSCHDVSEGGLAVAICECLFAGYNECDETMGANIIVPDGIGILTWLFSESQARFLISCSPTNVDRIIGLSQKMNVPIRPIGEVNKSGKLYIGNEYCWDVGELRNVYESSIPDLMKKSKTN